MPIHARLRRDDNNEEYYIFRYWGNSGGGYYTPEMTETQICQWLLQYELEKIARHFGGDFLREVDVAKRRGTSGLGKYDLLGSWEEEYHNYADNKAEALLNADPKRYLGPLINHDICDYGDRLLIVDGKKFRVTIKVEPLEEDEDDGLG